MTSFFVQRLEQRQKELERIYNPATAFGNPQVIALIDAINRDKAYLDETDECGYCGGKGEVEHDCDCPLCSERWEECKDCGGDGRQPKKK